MYEVYIAIMNLVAWVNECYNDLLQLPLSVWTRFAWFVTIAFITIMRSKFDKRMRFYYYNNYDNSVSNNGITIIIFYIY